MSFSTITACLNAIVQNFELDEEGEVKLPIVRDGTPHRVMKKLQKTASVNAPLVEAELTKMWDGNVTAPLAVISNSFVEYEKLAQGCDADMVSAAIWPALVTQGVSAISAFSALQPPKSVKSSAVKSNPWYVNELLERAYQRATTACDFGSLYIKALDEILSDEALRADLKSSSDGLPDFVRDAKSFFTYGAAKPRGGNERAGMTAPQSFATLCKVKLPAKDSAEYKHLPTAALNRKPEDEYEVSLAIYNSFHRAQPSVKSEAAAAANVNTANVNASSNGGEPVAAAGEAAPPDDLDSK